MLSIALEYVMCLYPEKSDFCQDFESHQDLNESFSPSKEEQHLH